MVGLLSVVIITGLIGLVAVVRAKRCKRVYGLADSFCEFRLARC